MPTTVQQGSVGDDVERVQRVLARLGFLEPIIDGDFGPRTEAAVVAFQSSRGLAADGVVGPDTWALLPTYRESSPILQEGVVGPVVRLLQQVLLDSNLYAGPVDGIYGPDTVESIRSYQRLGGVPDSGIVDDVTWLSPVGAGGRSLEAIVGLSWT